MVTPLQVSSTVHLHCSVHEITVICRNAPNCYNLYKKAYSLLIAYTGADSYHNWVTLIKYSSICRFSHWCRSTANHITVTSVTFIFLCHLNIFQLALCTSTVKLAGFHMTSPRIMHHFVSNYKKILREGVQ